MTTLRYALPALALAVLGLAVAACKGPGSSVAPGGFPTCNPCGVPHAQYVVVGDTGSPNSIITFNLGESKIPNSGDLAPTYDNHSSTLDYPYFIFNDFNSNIWAANYLGAKVTWYAVSATGGSPTSHTISGSNTELGLPVGIYISQNGTIYVADQDSGVGPAILIFAPGSSGNVAPSAWLAGATTTINDPQGLILDSQGHIWLVDDNIPGIDEFNGVALGSGANDVAPIGTITSGSLPAPAEITIDSQKHIWVTDFDTSGVMDFNPTPGVQTPLCDIVGSNTGLVGGQISVAVDNGGYVYAVQNGNARIGIWLAGQCGNVAPQYTISGASTDLQVPSAVLVYSTGNDY